MPFPLCLLQPDEDICRRFVKPYFGDNLLLEKGSGLLNFGNPTPLCQSEPKEQFEFWTTEYQGFQTASGCLRVEDTAYFLCEILKLHLLEFHILPQCGIQGDIPSVPVFQYFHNKYQALL